MVQEQADRLPEQHTEIEKRHQGEMRPPKLHEALHEIAADAEQEHDGYDRLRVIEEHKQRRRRNGQAEPRERLEQRRQQHAEQGQRMSCQP